MTDLKQQEEIISLTRKYLAGEASPEEITFLEKYYQHFDTETGITEQLSDSDKDMLETALLAGTWERTRETAVTIPVYKKTWFRIAAMLVIVAGALLIFLNNNNQPNPQPLAKQDPVTPVIVPGGNKAVLTLSDNRQLVLDDAANGDLAQQGIAKLVKQDGQLTYEVSGSSADVLFNTITTPRGGQYQLVLSDGTKVWLNASSSLHFPASFTGNERTVAITGEAYFEVAHNAAKPFYVDVAGKGIVEVLGTHFNINSYDDEASTKITLLEGLVKVKKGNSAQFLKPGQQAQLTDDVKVINNANIEEVMAWKNGKFLFEKTDVQTTMRQLARWYDAEIVYEENVSGYFSGTIPRNESVAKTLNMLQLTGEAHFRVEGKKIIVRR